MSDQPKRKSVKQSLYQRLRAAVEKHDAKLGQTYCGCPEHRKLRGDVIMAARALVNARDVFGSVKS